MVEKFLNLEDEKQTRIINAALKQFAQKGYTQSSTNEIVKDAEISKGLLFHYFKNKKGLYLFLYDYMYEVLMEELIEKVDWNEKDIFIKYKQLANYKLDVFLKYPEMFDFLKNAYLEEDKEVKSEIDKKTKNLLAEAYQKFFSEIDYSLFKEGLDVQKAVNIIFWSMEGFSNQQQEKIKLLTLNDELLNELNIEMDKYLEILREAFYK